MIPNSGDQDVAAALFCLWRLSYSLSVMSRMARWLALVFLANTAYVAIAASPTVFYMLNVLAHLLLGVA